MWLELFVTLIVGILTFWCYRYYHYYRYLKDIPSPKVWPIIGSGLEFRNSGDSIKIMLKNMIKLNTNTLRVHIGFRAIVMTKDYKFIEYLLTSQTILNKGLAYEFFRPWLGQGLLISTGEHWRTHRKMITPTFHFQILEQFFDVFHSNGTILIDQLRKQTGNPSIDVYPYITLCALDIICETAMGISINAQLEEDSLYAKCVSDMGQIIQRRGFNPFFYSDWIYKQSSLYKHEQECLKVLHGHTESVIKMRRENLLKSASNNEKTQEIDELGRKKKVPFLDMLLQANIDGIPLTDTEIRDEVSTFMFGGHDTTAAGTSFALYSLANNPEVQQKAFEELKDIFGGDKERPCTYNDLQEMKYMEMVIKETLRLYPSAPFYTRKALEDFEFDGITYPKEMTIGVLAYAIHRDPEYFPNPLEFQPERFSPENYDGKKPFSFIPFSAGPRNCVGQKFAYMEMKANLSRILRNFELLPATPTHIINLAADTILKSANGVKIAIAERKY